MAELARSGLLDLSVSEHQRFALDDINRAISGLQSRNGGFSNYVIVRDLVAETGRRIELYLALMLLCGRWRKLVALRQTVRCKCHQRGGDAGSGGRHREL